MWIFMLGLDAACKTTILYKVNLGPSVTTIPTVGFHTESVTNKEFNTWDVGVNGRDKAKTLWRLYYCWTLIFLVDCAHQDHMEAARQELHHIINDQEVRDAIILDFANKQDLPDATNPLQIQEKLVLMGILHRNWFV
ncbi:ADP-ribosylation factor 6-like [Heterocephalus glaber]|uniref:ADP-ribosylation factor 6-like n=1 Tax=Heterocephalus glaber TaxID=10181 RepID=A0AAX6QZC6_HETGA|nr:ADP-ribosylation factor 6-like [Heterocephalus glaber]